MAIKEVLVSDLTGKDIPDGQAARVTISDHPSLKGSTVEIDVAASEVEALQSKQFNLVSLTIHGASGAPRRVVMEAGDFNTALKGVDVEALLKNARRVDGTKRRSSAPKGERKDYSDPEHAGELHRGRITDAEKAFVNDNKEKASANRKRQTGEAIDWNDPAEKKRYGLK